MRDSPLGPRLQLVRDVAVLQIKLVVDGMRDAVLIPVSLIAAAWGLLRGGENAGRELRRVLNLARRSERWINVFGHETPLDRPHPVSSLDHLLARVESIVLEQNRKGRNTEEARAAIKAAMEDMSAESSRPESEE